MKRSTLVAIIVGLVAFIGAVAGALYVLKRRGILFVDDSYEYEFDDYSGGVTERAEVDAGGPREEDPEKSEEDADETEPLNHFEV